MKFNLDFFRKQMDEYHFPDQTGSHQLSHVQNFIRMKPKNQRHGKN
jgi:hypothetical protein